MEEKYRNLIEITETSEVIFHGKVFDTIVKTVSLADGRKSQREIVKHNGGACVLPIDDDLNCYMVRQFRSPFERILLEVPAGKLEPGEEPLHCAVRELHEETGFEASEMIDFGGMIASPGYDSEVIYLFMARGLKQIGQKLDEGELLNVEKIPLTTLLKMAEEGQISDSKTQLCIYKAARRLGI
ncbi:MAG: NUDIX hydrolase [Clostridiales bacterium]|nr:NUDIX hydrolase [Clostridiales bacterium]